MGVETGEKHQKARAHMEKNARSCSNELGKLQKLNTKAAHCRSQVDPEHPSSNSQSGPPGAIDNDARSPRRQVRSGQYGASSMAVCASSTSLAGTVRCNKEL
jgi:hypothetical protein